MKNKLMYGIIGCFLSVYALNPFSRAQEITERTEQDMLPTPLVEQGAYGALEKAETQLKKEEGNKKEISGKTLLNVVSLYGGEERTFRTLEEAREMNVVDHYIVCFEEQLNRQPYFLIEKYIKGEWDETDGKFPFKGQALTALGDEFFERYEIGQEIKSTLETLKDTISIKYATPVIKYTLRPVFNSGNLDSLEADSRLSLLNKSLTLVNRTGLERTALGLEKVVCFGPKKENKFWIYLEGEYDWEEKIRRISLRIVKK